MIVFDYNLYVNHKLNVPKISSMVNIMKYNPIDFTPFLNDEDWKEIKRRRNVVEFDNPSSMARIKRLAKPCKYGNAKGVFVKYLTDIGRINEVNKLVV